MADRKIISVTNSFDPTKAGQRRPAGTRSEYQGTKDADWECNSCGHKGITGNVKICPSCGNPKDSSEKYVAPPNDRHYLNTEELQARGVDRDHGSDEECPFCQARIAPKTQVCPQCGGNIKGVGKTSRICPGCERETNDLSCPACGTMTNPKTSKSRNLSPTQGNYQPLSERKNPNGIKKFLKIAGGIAGIALIIFTLVMIFTPKVKVGSVSQNSWSCSVPRQEYQYNFHGDWYLPQNADPINRYLKFHHYDQVYVRTDTVCADEWEVVGSHTEYGTEQVCETDSIYVGSTTTCYDDGTCDTEDNYDDVTTCHDKSTSEEVDDYGWVNHCHQKDIYRDVPVDQMWYEYNLWEWASIAPLTTSGNDNLITCSIVSETQTVKQVGDPDIACSTTFVVGEKQYQYQPDCASEFPLYTTDSQWQLTISGPSIIKVENVP